MTDFITREVHTVIDGEVVVSVPRMRIALSPVSSEKGRIVRDGRDVKVINGKWCYLPEGGD